MLSAITTVHGPPPLSPPRLVRPRHQHSVFELLGFRRKCSVRGCPGPHSSLLSVGSDCGAPCWKAAGLLRRGSRVKSKKRLFFNKWFILGKRSQQRLFLARGQERAARRGLPPLRLILLRETANPRCGPELGPSSLGPVGSVLLG